MKNVRFYKKLQKENAEALNGDAALIETRL